MSSQNVTHPFLESRGGLVGRLDGVELLEGFDLESMNNLVPLGSIQKVSNTQNDLQHLVPRGVGGDFSACLRDCLNVWSNLAHSLIELHLEHPRIESVNPLFSR